MALLHIVEPGTSSDVQLVLNEELGAETDGEQERAHFAGRILSALWDMPSREKYRKYLMTLPAWQLRERLNDLVQEQTRYGSDK